jgi:hypothetical protein
MQPENSMAIFQGKSIRRKWHNGEWYFAVIDIVAVLTDSVNPSDYLKKLRQRDEVLNEGWGQIVTPLAIETQGGPQSLNCVNTEGAFRVIQSIPSPKAEPFKLWLARVGYERVQEIANPELAMSRMKEIYKAKGYSEAWIEKRSRGIAVRNELTDEWSRRNVKENREFSILTAEISKAAFGLTPADYKKYKGLRHENLRDHMNDLELIFTMLGEAATTEIARKKNALGFHENKNAAVKGGGIAGDARKNLENESGAAVVSSENYLLTPEKVKCLEKKDKDSK